MGRPRGSRNTVVVLWLVLLLSITGAGLLWWQLTLLPQSQQGSSSERIEQGVPLLFGMVFLGIVAVMCLFGLVAQAITRRPRRRRDLIASKEGSELFWQADLGIVIDAVDIVDEQAPMLGLILPRDAPKDAAQQAAAVIGQRIAAGRGTAFMTIRNSLVYTGRGWPERGIGIDDLGNRFASMGSGRYVAVLPDGAVLDVDPEQGQPLDVSRIVQEHDVQRQFRGIGSELTFGHSFFNKVMVLGIIAVMVSIGVIMAQGIASSGPSWFQVVFWVMLGFAAVVVGYAFTQMFGRTHITGQGVAIVTPLRRQLVPWTEVRGFGVLRSRTRDHGSGQDTIGDDSRRDRYLYRIAVVDRQGYARALPGLGYRKHRRRSRPQWVVDRLCELDAFRRSWQ